MSNVTTLAAIDALNESGFDIDVVELADSDLVVQGVSQNQFAFGRGGTPETAISQGADIRIVVAAAGNEWTVYARTSIPDCAGLDGKKVAIHSVGGGSTARLKGWIEATCPGISPEFVVIAGSQNRYAALIADQIDASPLELADAVRLELEAGDRFHRLANLAQIQRLPTTIYGNNAFMQENPGSVEALIEALLEQHRMVADDPSYLQTLIERYVPNQENVAETAERYVEVGIFDVNGELTEEVAEGIVEFFENAEFIEPGHTAEDMFDLSYLNAVLERIGRE